MTIVPGGDGPKFVTGHNDPRLILVRDDGSETVSPILITTGTITKNADGTYDITIPEE